jgi:hypothetical protein
VHGVTSCRGFGIGRDYIPGPGVGQAPGVTS